MLGNLLFWWGSCWAVFCFGGVRVGQSFIFFNCYFVLVGFVVGNLLFSLIVVLFWWGSCWAIFCFGGVHVGESFVLVGSCWAIFCFGEVPVGQSFVFCTVFCRSLFVLCSFSIGHYIVCPSLTYGF